jgi:hypoxanthine phosphoribosyltransferase
MMEDKLYYTWEYLHRQTLDLADAILAEGPKFDYIAAISRGGLIPGVLMSHYMNLPLVPIEWSTRDHQQKTHYLNINEDIVNGKNILLVDDINDSGRTFIELLEDWEYSEGSEGRVVTAAVFERSTTQRPCDFYARLIQSNDWVVFPWEKK